MGLSKKEKEEYLKCRDNPIYFIENYVYIETEEDGIILFKLFDYQKELIYDLLNDKHNLHLWVKSRQIGASTLLSAYALWLANFHMSKSVAIIATDLRTAKKLHSKVRYAWRRLPDWMRMKHENKNMTQLFLKNRSKIEAFPYSKDKGTRSISASLVIMDESAFMINAEDVWGAIEPSLSKSGDVVALSSPDVPSGWFYDTYLELKMNPDNSDWKYTKLSWEVHPERDEEWRKEKDRRVGKRKARREYDAEFGVSDQAYFNPEYIDKIKDLMIQPPIKKLMGGHLWIWEEVQEGEEYLITVDPAEGARDKSCIQVLKMSTMEQVAEYLATIHYDKFNYIPVQVAKMYNNGLLIIEDNSIGKTTISRSKDLNYMNIFKRGQSKKERDILGIRTTRDGWNTNTKTRPMLIKSLESFIETDEGFITIRSERLLEQLMTFIDKNGKPQAQSDGYDDAIMAIAMACFIYEIRGIKLSNPDTEFDILEMYSMINKKTREEFESIRDYDEKINSMSDEEKDEEILKKKRKDILKKKGQQFNVNNPYVEAYMETWRNEFDF